MEKRVFETSWPLPILFIGLVAFVTMMIYPVYVPSPKQWDQWLQFHFRLITIIYFLSVPTIIYGWPFHPGCTLSYRIDNRLNFLGVIRTYNNPCGQPSIGRVKVIEKSGEPAKWKYFCKRCDPQKQYFKQILRGRYDTVFMYDIFRFRIVQKDPQADGREKEEEDPPDLKIS